MMNSHSINLDLKLFAKVLEAVHQCTQGTKPKLGKIRLTENTYGIFFDCCKLKMTFPKKLSNDLISLNPDPVDEDPTKLEYDEVIFIDIVDEDKFESVFINIEDERPLSRDPLSNTCKKGVGDVDPLLVEQNLVSTNKQTSLERNLSKNVIKISSRNFLPKVVDWSCESIENISSELHPQKKKEKYPSQLICEFCGLQFVGKDRVYNFFHHRNQYHTRDIKYNCPICKKTYWGERQLSAHIVSHTGKEYICEICGIAFHRKNDLQRHALIHENKSFSCKICFKNFRRKDNLTIHEKIHTRINLHNCTNCRKGFPQKHQLNLHKKKCK